MEWAAATAHPERIAPRPARGRAITAGKICERWVDPNLMETAEQARQRLVLSRIMTAAGVCEPALDARLSPNV